MSKSAAAAGATATLVAPAAEEALGESADGLRGARRGGGERRAAAEEGRPAKEPATRSPRGSHASRRRRRGVAARRRRRRRALRVDRRADERRGRSRERRSNALKSRPWNATSPKTKTKTRGGDSHAARAAFPDAPCASEAPGATAVGAVDAAAERPRLTRGIRARARRAAASNAPPRSPTPRPARMDPSAAANLARRVVHAFAPFAPQEGDDETGDVDPDGEMTLDAWDASVDAAASLADAVEEGECPGDENASERANLAAKIALAGDVARHVRAYWRAAAALEDEDDEDEDEDEDEDAGSPRTSSDAPAPAHASLANLVRFACESIAEAVEKKTSVAAADAEAVWSAAGAWASYLPAWRLAGDDAADDAAFEAAAAMVARRPRRARPRPRWRQR